MNVLNIVTNQNINFFKNQVGELNQRGIRSSVITPRQQRADELGSAGELAFGTLITYRYTGKR